LRNVKENVSRLCDEMKSVKESLTKILTGQAEMKGEINTLRAEVKGSMEALEKKMIQWFVATALSCAGLAFSAAKLFG